MRYTVRPLSDRTWLGSMGKEATRFKSKWGATLELLGTEIDHLNGRDVVIETDITEGDLKLNGELRANARPSSPAVVVAFESKHGPMLYRCDRFYASYYDQGPDWQHNARAIALTLQALRAVDRYGATETGQQYTGFKALPAGRAMPPSHMTSEQALQILREASRLVAGDDLGLTAAELYRKARIEAHPDRHEGDHTLAYEVDQAAQVLGVTR